MISTARSDRKTSLTTHVWLFVVAAAIVAALGLQYVAQNDWNPTTLLRVGAYSASRSAVEKDFSDPVLTPDYGHDGQQFYVLAVTFPNLPRAEGDVDHITYRARRILLPMLASPAPAGAPTVWAMFVIYVIAVAFAAVGVGRLASRIGVTPWVGLSVAVMPAMIESVQGSLGDALAFSLAIWAVVLWRRNIWWSAGLLVLAALSRETSLVAAIALLVVVPRRDKVVLGASFVGWAAIAGAITVWLHPYEDTAGTVLNQWAVPLTALLDQGAGSTSMIMAVGFFAMSLFAAWVLRTSLPEIALWVLFEAALLLVVNDGVAARPMNLSRVVPIAVPAFFLAAGAVLRSRDARPAVAD